MLDANLNVLRSTQGEVNFSRSRLHCCGRPARSQPRSHSVLYPRAVTRKSDSYMAPNNVYIYIHYVYIIY